MPFTKLFHSKYHHCLLVSFHTCVCAQFCPTLCDSMDYSPPDSSIHGIFQARILEWVTISSSRGLPNPGIEHTSPELAGLFFTTEPPEKPFNNTSSNNDNSSMTNYFFKKL
ncbi:unnamed protein product [Rangifer tarandus platyrhynchus]|uniref:Secreted protein n=1 Tax=Rangifer tarandus platyrhynchus TaxID=3082113 RepID=A0ABN8YJT3_RANTA|nr:unnamed protein product [Rangifer tarandus platyrhynchus]